MLLLRKEVSFESIACRQRSAKGPERAASTDTGSPSSRVSATKDMAEPAKDSSSAEGGTVVVEL